MDAVVLDTSVASLLHPKKRSSLLEWYRPHLRRKIWVISFQSVAELWAWALVNRWGTRRRQSLEALLHRFAVVAYDFALARIWAQVMTSCQDQGRRLEAGDAWIVATAVYRRLPLLTNDADQLGLRLPNLEVISALESRD